ncbi:class I SAM-dependent methyltransferase [Thauera sp. Sel9]|uniref:class I SAM-dependent methyltransferase n=1 Tax=Thauera sp. Sel9 TaxID=2974299 RepID=UPI0021E1A8B0|nr:class I SAM-dependent methyltransferase [Thauera sp. Sel9]MCV2219799.1 class I SAM-dependent methyltransferase [Thauera sp. Sel9]
MTRSSSAPGYITDTGYPWHFHRETMPAWNAAILTALGRRAPDLTRPYTWLELGCGSGLDVVVGAATNPQGRFIGIDFNARAIEQGRALARDAGVGNASFHCLGFEQVLEASESGIPACDFLVVHGVYSWVSAEARSAIRRIVAQKLKPGGVLYLSYLSHPGFASFAAARRLMRMVAADSSCTSADKARSAMAFLQRMSDAGAGYFQDHPGMLPATQPIDDATAAFLAHEYLNEHWDVLHTADVMAELAEAGCEYAGSAAPCENVDSASLPPATQGMLEELRRSGADAAVVETFKDLARNQTQRCDIYQRRRPGGNLLSDPAHQAGLLGQRVCLLPAAPAGPIPVRGSITFSSRIGPVSLPMGDVAPLLALLQDGPCSYADLAGLSAYAQRPGFVNLLLQILAWAGWLQFLRPDLHSAGGAECASRLNAVLARSPAPFNGPILAAAAIGSAIPVPDGSAGDMLRLEWLEWLGS